MTFPPKLEALAAVSARASFFGRYGFGCDRFGILAIMLRMRRTSIRPLPVHIRRQDAQINQPGQIVGGRGSGLTRVWLVGRGRQW